MCKTNERRENTERRGEDRRKKKYPIHEDKRKYERRRERDRRDKKD